MKHPSMAKYGSTSEMITTMRDKEDSLSLKKRDSTTKETSKHASSAATTFVLLAKKKETAQI